jgi:hypothetical protein
MEKKMNKTKPGPGAPKGNQNAKKTRPKKRYSFRLSNQIKGLIEAKAKSLGISQAEYLTWLVTADNI